MSTDWRVGLVGDGEEGRVLAEGLHARDVAVGAYDIERDRDDVAAALDGHAAADTATLAPSHASLAGEWRAQADRIPAVLAPARTPRRARPRLREGNER